METEKYQDVKGEPWTHGIERKGLENKDVWLEKLSFKKVQNQGQARFSSIGHKRQTPLKIPHSAHRLQYTINSKKVVWPNQVIGLDLLMAQRQRHVQLHNFTHFPQVAFKFTAQRLYKFQSIFKVLNIWRLTF